MMPLIVKNGHPFDREEAITYALIVKKHCTLAWSIYCLVTRLSI
jgi:hypothetical protein